MKKVYEDLIQGSDEWFNVRRGILTASAIKKIMTPKTLKLSAASEGHLYDLAAQTIQKYVEPSYVGFDMLRGIDDEPIMRQLYNDNIAPVKGVGFVTEDKWGFTLGCSPDALVGDRGAIECKSMNQKIYMETVITGKPDTDHALQLQSGLLIAGLDWIDYCFASFTPELAPDEAKTLPMVVYRVYPSQEIQDAIISVAGEFYERLAKITGAYEQAITSEVAKFIPTQRKKMEQEIEV